MTGHRSDTPDWLQTLIALLGLVLFCWVLLRFGGLGGAPSESPVVVPSGRAGTAPAAPACSHVVHNCVAATEVVFDGESSGECSERRGKQRIETALRNPLEVGECLPAVEKLSANCPLECMLSAPSLLVVPSQLKMKVDPKPNESGLCTVRGEIALTVRATCIPKE